MKDFDKNTTCTYNELGVYEISCNKGLWAVSGADGRKVLAEARHYYRQYASDGEYDGTADEKLIASIGGVRE